MPSYPASASPYVGQTIDNGALRIESILGAGTFGVVYRAVDIRTGVHYAVKRVEKEGYQTRESKLHARVSSHPHVLTFHREFHEGPYTFYVYDLCAGDLYSSIRKVAFFREDELIKRVFVQIIDALEYCHARGVYHRDLKPENILVSAESGDIDIFVADFGLATASKTTVSPCGTPCFMGPGMSPLCVSTLSILNRLFLSLRVIGAAPQALLFHPRRYLGTRLHPRRDDRQCATLVVGYPRGRQLQRLFDGSCRPIRHPPRIALRIPAPSQIILHQAGAAAVTRRHPQRGARDGHILPHRRGGSTVWMGRSPGEAEAAENARMRSCRCRTTNAPLIGDIFVVLWLLRVCQLGVILGITLFHRLIIVGV
jgi:hypothetical protein